MLRCEEVTRLQASDAIPGSPWRTRLAVRLHLLMCDACRRYRRELRGIGEAARGAAGDESPSPEQVESLLQRAFRDASDGER